MAHNPPETPSPPGPDTDEVRLLAALLPVVYDELRRLAQSYMKGEAAGHTLSATALVHEAYLKLIGQRSVSRASRAQFFAAAAQAMRRILVDHARARRAQKRGGRAARIPLDDEIAWFEVRSLDLESLDAAIQTLARSDAPKARLIELRFFAAVDMPQAAELLGLPLRTVEREWTLAKARLRELMGISRDGSEPDA